MTDLLPPAHDATQPPRAARRLRPAHIGFLLIFVIAAALRLYKIDGQSLWQDEVYSILSSNGWWASSIAADQVLDPVPDHMSVAGARSLVDVCPALAEHDNHPPLYFLMLRVWRTVLGEGPAASRSLSLVASLIGLALLTDVARMLFGWGPALWAAAIMAVAGPQIQFAQEIRGYMLLMAAGCGAMNAVVRIQLYGPTMRRLAALVAWLVAMELTHFFAVGAAAGLAAYAMIALRGAARWRVLAAMLLAAVIFAAVWGRETIRQFSNVSANNLYMLQGEQGAPVWVLMRLAKVPHRFFDEPMDSSAGLAMLSATAYVLPLLLVRRRPALLLGMLYVAGGVGIVAAFDLYRGSGNLDFIRYSLVAAPGAYLVTVGLLSHRRGWLGHVIPAVALLSCLVSLPRAYQYFIPIKPDWRALATAAATSMGPRDAMVLTGNPSDVWYYELSYYHPASPRRLLILTRPMTAEQVAALGSSERIGVVGARKGGDGINALVGNGPPLAEYHEAWLPPLAIYQGPAGASSGGPSTSPGYNAPR